MAERESALIVSVEVLPEASGLVGDHLAGATVLTVAEGRVFGEAGTCRILDVDYEYARDENTLTIVPGLVGAASDGEPVARVGATGDVESRKVVNIDFDGDGESDDQAEVRSADRGYFAEGDSLAGTWIEVQHTIYGYEAITRPFEQPALDRSVIKSPLVSLELAANQTIPSGPVTTVTGWGGTTGTKAGIYGRYLPDLVVRTGADGVNIDVPGAYLAILTIDWANNTSGGRTANLVLSRDGVEIETTQAAAPPNPNGRSTQQVSLLFVAEGNEALKADVAHSAGASLDIRTALTKLRVFQVAIAE